MEKDQLTDNVFDKYPNLLAKRDCEDLSNEIYRETGLVNSPRDFDDDRNGLMEIEHFLIDEFGITNADISFGWNTNIFNGKIFRINSEDKELICEIRVVLLANAITMDKNKILFSAKMWIEYPEMGELQYKSFCSDIKKKIHVLGLRRFSKDGNRCTNPTMFEVYDNISIDMFKNFIQRVQKFREDFLLKYPGDDFGLLFW